MLCKLWIGDLRKQRITGNKLYLFPVIQFLFNCNQTKLSVPKDIKETALEILCCENKTIYLILKLLFGL